MAATVGVREFKTRLGKYLHQVRAGATLVVTDRGMPIVEVRPLPANGRYSPALLAAAARGEITLPTKPRRFPPFRPIRMKGNLSLSDAIVEDREDRF